VFHNPEILWLAVPASRLYLLQCKLQYQPPVEPGVLDWLSHHKPIYFGSVTHILDNFGSWIVITFAARKESKLKLQRSKLFHGLNI
jgi:hypothetical protein